MNNQYSGNWSGQRQQGQQGQGYGQQQYGQRRDDGSEYDQEAHRATRGMRGEFGGEWESGHERSYNQPMGTNRGYGAASGQNWNSGRDRSQRPWDDDIRYPMSQGQYDPSRGYGSMPSGGYSGGGYPSTEDSMFRYGSTSGNSGVYGGQGYGSTYGSGSGAGYGERQGASYGGFSGTGYGERGGYGQNYGSGHSGYGGASNIGYGDRRTADYGGYSGMGYGVPQYGSSQYGVGSQYGSSYDNSQYGSRQGGQNWAGSERGTRGVAPRGYKKSDDRIKEDVCERLVNEGLDCGCVDIAVKDGIVTLSGEVNARPDKHRIEQIADAVSGVTEVENQLKISKSQSDRSAGSRGTTDELKPSGNGAESGARTSGETVTPGSSAAKKW